MKALFQRTATRAILLGSLTIAVSVSIGLLGNWSSEQKCFRLKIVFFILSCIVYITVFVLNTIFETNERRLVSEVKKQAKIYAKVISDLETVCVDTSGSVTDIMHAIEKTGAISFDSWSFNKACKNICTLIYDLILEYTAATRFDVTYVRLDETAKESDCVYLCAYASQMHVHPTVFNIKRYFNTNDKNKYYDLKLFSDNSSDISVLIGQEIYDNFCFTGVQKDAMRKNKQYVALPVFCKGNKMIGLLEITCHEDNALGTTRDEILEFADKYLMSFVNYLLLLHKMEKALIIGTAGNIITSI